MGFKIGIEAQRIFRENKHGMDFVALEMIRNLQAIDKVNEYVVFVKPDKDKCLEPSENFRIVELSATTYPYWEQVMLPGAAKSEKVQLLHCTSNTAPMQTAIPSVVTLHDVIYMEKSPFSGGSLYQMFGNLYRRMVVPGVVNRAKCVITVSNYEKNVIAAQFPEATEKIEVIYNGKSKHFHNRYSEAEINTVLEKYGIHKPFLFFLGNTDPKKNLTNVVKAFVEFCRAKENAPDLVIADYDAGRLQSLLGSINGMEFQHKFVLPGYIPNKDLPLIYNGAMLFLYPSLRESFGIPIIEAMACGTPVITSNAASMPEVSGGAAVLINPERAEELSGAIERLLTEQETRKELIEKGLLRASEFEWEFTSRKVAELYNKLIMN